MNTHNDTTPTRTKRRLIALAAFAGAVAIAGVTTAMASPASSAGNSAAPPTTALNGVRSEVVAILYPAPIASLASTGGRLIGGPILAMAGIAGDDWNADAPRRVVFYLLDDASIAQVEQVVHALDAQEAVQAVQVSIPG